MEDSALFLRYVLERLTRDRQDQMFKLLRHLIRFVPRLPQQAAFALYNYIIGYVMFYVRSSHEQSQQVNNLFFNAFFLQIQNECDLFDLKFSVGWISTLCSLDGSA